MNIHIVKGYFHHMNKRSLNDMIEYSNWNRVESIEDADVIYSPSTLLDTTKHPDKQFIFGPHFSVFPNSIARQISGENNNAIYIQPSQPSVNTWVDEFSFKNIPVKEFPFPLRLQDYNVSEEDKDIALIYYKKRSPEELSVLKSFVESKGLKYELITYGSYKEGDYQKKLNRAKFVIWLGQHESQGFALQSVMCKNIPLLVWGVKLRSQEEGCPTEYYNVKSEVSTVPYWDKSCGELFFKENELEDKYNFFVENLDKYQPRKFIHDNLTVEKCSERFVKLISDIKKYQKQEVE